MTVNEALARYAFLTQIKLSNGTESLAKDLKVKVMTMRIEYAKVRKAFDEDVQEFVKGLSTDELSTLSQKQERTLDEETRIKKLEDELNSAYYSYTQSRGSEEVQIKDRSFTEDEFVNIIEVNADTDADINGQKLAAADFLEVLHTLFVEE